MYNRRLSEPPFGLGNYEEEQQRHYVQLPLLPASNLNFARQRNTSDVTTGNITRFLQSRGNVGKKFSLTTVSGGDGDEDFLPFGEAIRVGDVGRVDRFIVNNGQAALDVRFSFQLSVERPKNPDNGKNMPATTRADQTDGLQSDTQKATVEITALHLAILAQHTAVTKKLLERTLELGDVVAKKALLLDRTKIVFKEESDNYNKSDRLLDGLSALHVAAKYHPASLIAILNTLRNCPFLKELLECQSANDLCQTPLQMAAKNTDSAALR
jgi:hypothetical protein